MPDLPEPNRDASRKQVLVIDDEPDIRELLAMTLHRMDAHAVEADSVRQAKTRLSEQTYDLCLTDMRLPDGSGLDIVEHIQQQYPQLPVAVITAFGNAESAVKCLKAGAFDFVQKPIKLEDLRAMIKAALELDQTRREDGIASQNLVGDSPKMQQLRTMIAKVSKSQAPVLISGETGTGKELVARLIHSQSSRSNGPFIAVNCGAIPGELMESEFFGHLKGSFTGAFSDKTGLFQSAQHGTLFLDEVADLPKPMQVKLLRTIQEKTVRPIGERREIPIDVRILSATHKNLADMVKTDQFREDLFFRLNVIGLPVPSLRERLDDVGVLAQHILKRIARTMEIDSIGLTDKASKQLKCHRYPGNIRELENILERASALCDHSIIDEQDLQVIDLQSPGQGESFDPAQESLDQYLHRVEREAIEQALLQTAGNKTAAAKLLGVSFRALRYKLAKFDGELDEN